MQQDVMIPDQAWDAYRVLRTDRRIVYLPEPAGLPEIWHAFAGDRVGPNLWTDAYLCTFAHAAGLILVTFDAKIPRSPDVGCLVLDAHS